MAGRITVITGEMFSGKSQELARRVRAALRQGLRVELFVAALASRGSPRDLAARLPECAVMPVPDDRPELIADWVRPDTEVVVIDEAQFFAVGIVRAVRELRARDKQVWIAGLDQDYREQPFGCMGDLLCIANDIVKLHATCAECGRQDAYISYRLSAEDSQRLVGDDLYRPVCHDCYARLCAAEVPRR